MVILSTQLNNCLKKKSTMLLSFFEKGFYLRWFFHGNFGIRIAFDPWTGNELYCKYDYEFSEIYESEKELKSFLDKFGPIECKKSRKFWDINKQKSKKQHCKNKTCKELEDFLKGGDEEGMTSIIHIPNIRTYAILNKKEYGGFEPMDYCPFCGAKLPNRLDEKLSEILRKEYGLNSWKDYKKAPHEFYTEEWWKKRGL